MDSKRIEKLAAGVRDRLKKDIAESLGRVMGTESAERLAFPHGVANVERLAAGDADVLVEWVAYTWFNRLVALRFMDARGYTPVGCVTPRPGETLPALLSDARQGILHDEFPFKAGSRQRMMGLLDGSVPAANPLDEAYTLLLLSACDAYGSAMGYLFGGGAEHRSAMRLLHPSNLTAEDGVLAGIVAGMDEEACQSVEVLGWLYQFYVAEQNKAWNSSKDKAAAKDIAVATEFFTPNYIVRFLAENSLGRLWMLNNPDSELAGRMDYYIAPEPGQTGAFARIDGPEDITVCDPACGSGHILVYAFDLLYQMYEEEGYLADEIPQLILENNLWGMEIDRRAAEIASFALEMMAREKDPDFFKKNVDPHITVLEPIELERSELTGLRIAKNHGLLEAFGHLTECGSLYVPKPEDLQDVNEALAKLAAKAREYQAAAIIDQLKDMRAILEALGKQFDCVIANPPYMGSSSFNPWVSTWIKDNYPTVKGDLCTCFIKRGLALAKQDGYIAEVTMHSWMFISSYEKMRHAVINQHGIAAMVHLGPHAFDAINGEKVQVAATVFTRAHALVKGSYVRVVNPKEEAEKDKELRTAVKDLDGGWFYRADAESFKSIPGWVIGYWASASTLDAFKKGVQLNKIGQPRVGLQTGKNALFVREWWEVARNREWFDCPSIEASIESGKTWFPYNKGGEYRKWYGNNECVVNWENDGFKIRHNVDSNGKLLSRPQNTAFFFKPSITWSKVSSGAIAFRYKPQGCIFDVAGTSIFANEDTLKYLQGVLNSSIILTIAGILSPTLNFEVGQIATYPIIIDQELEPKVNQIVDEQRSLSRTNWDAFETSWDFQTHPLAQPGEPLIERQFARWQAECQVRFDTLKANEEELNRIFVTIYHMEGEVDWKVPDDKVSVRRANELRDVKSLISYGIGCIFGRYSTDKPGLILADAGQTAEDYRVKVPGSAFSIDEDDVLPVTALDDVTLEDDVVRRFRGWLAYAYGQGSLDANVAYLERVLGKSLRAYFSKDFYRDHCATYSVQGSGKRPIYWMLASPKGSFQALVYLHRMVKNTVGCVLTEYVRPFRARLAAHIGVLRATGAARDGATADRYQVMVDELEAWERDVLYPLSQRHVEIDLDVGVRQNYKLFRTDGGDALAKVAGLS